MANTAIPMRTTHIGPQASLTGERAGCYELTADGLMPHSVSANVAMRVAASPALAASGSEPTCCAHVSGESVASAAAMSLSVKAATRRTSAATVSGALFATSL